MKKDLTSIFVGSDIEAKYISSILLDNQIKNIVQNTLEGSINAGWVSGSPDNCSVIYVKIEDSEEANRIIKEFFGNKQ